MWDSFLKDNSSFKKKISVYLFISFLALITAYGFNILRNTQAAENNKLAATYTAQSEWLNKIDYEEMDALHKAVLKPVKSTQIEKIQQEQLNILRSHNLAVTSVSNNASKAKKNEKIKFVSTKVTLLGSWDNIIAALNEFETKNLVVITDLDISPDKAGTLITKLDYNIYYQ